MDWQDRDTTNADFPQGTTLLAALRQRLGTAHVVFDANGTQQAPARFDAFVAVLAEAPYAEDAGDIRINENLRRSGRCPLDLAVLRRVAGRGAPVITLL